MCLQGPLASLVHKGVFKHNKHWSQRVAHRGLLRTAAEIATAMSHLHSKDFIHGGTLPYVTVCISKASKIPGAVDVWLGPGPSAVC